MNENTESMTNETEAATAAPDTPSSFTASEYIADATLWQTPALREEGFLLEIQGGLSNVVKEGLGEPGTEFNSVTGQERQARAEEWGYSMTHLDGVTDGMGRVIETNYSQANKPSDRAEAVERIFAFLEKQYKSKSVSGVYYSMNGHYPWHHYAGENGFDILGSEIGENINSYQLHIALNRGAARQYQTPWFIDFSMWHGAGILDYSDVGVWGEYSGSDRGHSLSVFERSMLMSYMAGADSLVMEAGDVICFYSDGSVSPYGEVCRKLYAFTQSHDIGVSYTPYALILDYYHGMYSGFDGKNAFYYFPYNDGDNFTWSMVDSIWKGGWEVQSSGDESGVMVNNKWGDTFDMVLQNVSAELCATYPVMIMTGDTTLSDEEVEKYTTYVENGGTLVLNTAYSKQFPDLSLPVSLSGHKEFSFGEGSVIVFGSNWKVNNFGDVMELLAQRFIPFTISDDIEYQINVRDGALLLTLINNDGVTKRAQSATQIDETKAVELEIVYTGGHELRGVSDIYNGTPLTLYGNKVSITIPSGSAAVLEFLLG